MSFMNSRKDDVLLGVLIVAILVAVCAENSRADHAPIGVLANPTDQIGKFWRANAYSICPAIEGMPANVYPGCYPGTHYYWTCLVLSPGVAACSVPHDVPVAYQHSSGLVSPKAYHTLPEPSQLWSIGTGIALLLALFFLKRRP